MTRIAFIAFALLLLAIGASYRLARLDLRPFHGDEANQAVKTGQLLEKGVYHYDPHEHHGPTLYYAALPVLRAFGVHRLAEASEAMFRLVPALFGIATLALTIWMARGLGREPVLWAIAFGSISHGLTYYSRYYIQESLLVFFALVAIAAAWRYLRSPGWTAAIACGVALGLMHATKETCVLFFVAMAAALAATSEWPRIADGERLKWPEGVRWAHLLAGVMSALIVSVVLFSSFFTYARGPLDSVLTFFTYANRAEGAGSVALHDKPWYYYFTMLLYTYREAGPRWSEAPIVFLAMLGAAVALRPRAKAITGDISLWRFLSFYTVALIVLFSLVPYKTPWNFLGALHAMTLLAGLGAAWLVALPRRAWLRVIVVIVLCAAWGFQARQSYLGNFVYAADTRNPYVYAHTSTALVRLVHRIETLAAASKEGTAMRIDVVLPSGDYWPLPWYFRTYTHVGYWPQIPAHIDASIVITSPALADAIRPNLKGTYVDEYHALRPGVLLLVFVRK